MLGNTAALSRRAALSPIASRHLRAALCSKPTGRQDVRLRTAAVTQRITTKHASFAPANRAAHDCGSPAEGNAPTTGRVFPQAMQPLFASAWWRRLAVPRRTISSAAADSPDPCAPPTPPIPVPREIKAAVCGCSGNVGRILSLLLKQSTFISELALYDIYMIPKVLTDISTINTKCRVNFHEGINKIQLALKDADIVVIAAGVSRCTGMSRKELFTSNARVVYGLARACATVCPDALIAIITNPINSMVPIASEVLRKHNCYDSNRVFGVATPHVIRACTMMARYIHKDPQSVTVPIIGGNDSLTLVPVLSKTAPCTGICLDTESVLKPLTCSIREASMDVVRAKNHMGSCNLFTAYAATRFTTSLAKGLKELPSIVECAYVRSTVITGCRYVITPVELGPNGISCNCGLPKLNPYESKLLEDAIPKLKADIKLGEDFIKLAKQFCLT